MLREKEEIFEGLKALIESGRELEIEISLADKKKIEEMLEMEINSRLFPPSFKI